MNAGIQSHTSRRSKRSRAGTTLLETIISLSLFALFSVGSSRLIMTQHQLSAAADDHYFAAHIAKSRLETIRAFQFADPTQILDFEETAAVVNKVGELTPRGNYRRVTTCSLNANSTVCEVIVDVQIRNRTTLKFENTKETIKSYFQ